MKVSIQPTPPNLLSASKEAVLESQAQALREKVGSLEEPVAESGNNDGVMRLRERVGEACLDGRSWTRLHPASPGVH